MSLVSHWVVDNFLTFIYISFFCLSTLFYICVLEKTTLNLNCSKGGKILYVKPITLSRDFESIELFPLSDLHIGCKEYSHKEFLKYKKYILEKENRFCFINGDLINNGVKSSVTNIYEEVLTPREQIEEAVAELGSLKDRIWGYIRGNHEYRTDRESGISPAEFIAYKLGIPYLGVQALFKIKFGMNRHKRPSYYTLYATHGHGGGRMKGGKANNLDRLKNIVMADVYCMGHTHTKVILDGQVNLVDQKNDMIIQKDIYFVNSGAFLERGESYAAAACYEPQNMGCPCIWMSGTERKINPVMNRV